MYYLCENENRDFRPIKFSQKRMIEKRRKIIRCNHSCKQKGQGFMSNDTKNFGKLLMN